MWCGVDEKSKRRQKEGCAVLMSPRIWQDIEAHGWKASRIMGSWKDRNSDICMDLCV